MDSPAKRNRPATCQVAMIVEIGYNAKLLDDTDINDCQPQIVNLPFNDENGSDSDLDSD